MASEPVPFIDGHNDVLLALYLAGEGATPFLARRSEGHLDLERAREGGFAAGLFAVFVLPETEEERAATQIPDRKPPYAVPLAGPVPTEYASREAGRIVDLLDELVAGGEVRLARSAGDVEAALGGGPLAAILHFEGAATKRTWPSWRTATGCACSARPGVTRRQTLFTTAGAVRSVASDA
jgi:membrane dipeptidase